MRILTVDDDSLIRKIIRRELQPAGYQIIEANDGKEGLEKLFTIDNIDLVTLDIEMPVMNGFEVLTKVHDPTLKSKLESTNNTDLPVILVTANDTQKIRDKGFYLGASNFVVKPFSKGELLYAVNSILNPNDYFKDLGVLVTDDSKTTRQFIASSIKELGVTIYEADDGTTAYDLLKKIGKDIDLIISDLNMKRMDGDKLCRKVRTQLGFTDLPFIFLSSNEDRNKILELFKIGATDYISKPFFKEELLARMNVHLAHCKMNKLQKQTISELKGTKRLKSLITSLFTQDLRPLLQNIIDSANNVAHGQFDDLKPIMNTISSSSQALLYKVNHIYDELDRIMETTDTPNKSRSQNSNNCSVLIAEAHKMDMLLLSKLLQSYDCDIITAKTATQTIEAVQNITEHDPVDIIFLDIDSLEINGLTTVKKIQHLLNEKQKKQAVIIAITNVHAESQKHTCKISGISEIMAKPIKRLQLQAVMNKYGIQFSDS